MELPRVRQESSPDGMAVQIFDEIPINIDKHEILRLQGRHGQDKLSQPVRRILDEMLDGCRSLLQPRAVCVRMDARVMRKSVRLINGLSLRNPDGARVWHNADSLAAVVCTIGPALEKRVSELSAQGASTAALMLDGIGSAAAESVADRVNQSICRDAARGGMRAGPRLSPGYGTWPLEDQMVIFNIVPAERIGVHLNEQGMMIPVKSVSFCVGLGRDLSAYESSDPCQYCNLENCRYRKVPRGPL